MATLTLVPPDAKPGSFDDPDVQKIFDVLCAARVARASLVSFNGAGVHGFAHVVIYADHHPDAKYAIELYASALAPEGMTLTAETNVFDDGMQVRSLHLSDRNGRFASVQFPAERVPVVGDASTVWSPAHEGRQ